MIDWPGRHEWIVGEGKKEMERNANAEKMDSWENGMEGRYAFAIMSLISR